jgi:hypothetical protein
MMSAAWRPWNEATASSTEQRSSRLGVFSCKGFPQGCTVLGLQLLAILGDHGLPASGYGKLFDLSVQENSRLERNRSR